MFMRYPKTVHKIYQRPAVKIFANQEIYCLSDKLSFQRKQKKISPPQFYFKLLFYSVFYFHRVRDVHKGVTEIKEGEGTL